MSGVPVSTVHDVPTPGRGLARRLGRVRRRLADTAALVAVAPLQLGVLLTSLRAGFGGEDPMAPADDFANWHHRGISDTAARETGWSEGAAREMSWHADFVDSYLYNPLWWVRGGLPRIKTALSLAPALANVHFDDLTSTGQIQAMWRRYRSGAVAGVAWAATADLPEAERVAAARHVLGVVLHATQDFYSHSTWVNDPGRRSRVWSDLSPAEQSATSLFTGTYEHAEHLGIEHHGKYSFGCSAMQPAASQMSIICHAASPFSNTSLCQIWKACRDSVPIGRFEVLGVPVPSGLVYLDPPGIALDSTWLAKIGTQQRGFPVEQAPALFQAARALAVRDSKAMLGAVGRAVQGAGHAGFWQQVLTAPANPESMWHAQFEDFHRQGLHFIGAGAYPPAPTAPVHEWFLRLRLTTSSDLFAGTDADIYAGTAYGETKLDTMAGRNPLIAYNDFEAGDDQVFHIGPYPDAPTQLWLRNDTAGIGEVLVQLGQTFIEAFRDIGKALADFFLSIIGGHADLVATTHRVWTPAQLSAIGTTQNFDVLLDGGSEGRYRVYGRITRTRRGVANGRPVSDYAVDLDRLYCIKESSWDRGSNSDEPFLFAMLINQASLTAERLMFGPYNDVDTGESRTLGRRLLASNVPDGLGHLTLPLQLMESDDEGSGRRAEAFNSFSGIYGDRTKSAREGFIAALGRSVAADWNVAGLTVDAYRTGDDRVVVGRMLGPTSPGLIRGDERRTFALDRSRLREIVVAPGTTPPVRRREPQRSDFDGDGRSEVFIHSNWGIGALSLGPAGAASLAMHERGTRIDGWLLDTRDNKLGPVGDFDGDRRDEILITSGWGLGVLEVGGGAWRGLTMFPNGTRFGEWLLNTVDNRFGPVGDFDGDGRDEFLVTSPWGIGLLQVSGTSIAPIMMAGNGTRFGGWLLNTADNRFGPVADFDGDGRDEIMISSPWGVAILKFVGGGLSPIMMAQNGTRFGGWLLNTADNRFGPVGDFRASGRADVVFSSPWGLGVLAFDGTTLTPRMMEPNGKRFGDWLLNTADNRFHEAAVFGRGRADLYVSSPWGIGVLGFDAGGAFTSIAMTGNGTRIDGWLLNTAENQFPQIADLTGDGNADVLFTSPWGVGVLCPGPAGFRMPFLAPNGTWLGGWLLSTPENTFGALPRT